MRVKDVSIGKRGLAFEMLQGGVDAGQKRVVLQPLNDGGIFGFGDVTQVTARFRNHQRDRRSWTTFAQVPCLKANGLGAAQDTCPL
jgi:hypothetical protein